MPVISVEVDGKHRPAIKKRDFTLEYLEERGLEGAYVKEIYDGWVDFCIRFGKKPGTYKDFRNVIWALKNDGIIEKFKEESVPNRWNRAYYKLSF